jgi:hypothetical protein
LQHFEQSTPSLIDPGHPPPLSQVKVVEIPSHPVQSFAPTLPMTIALDMVTQYAIKKADRKTTNARFIVTPPNVSAFQSQIVPPPPPTHVNNLDYRFLAARRDEKLGIVTDIHVRRAIHNL